MNKKLNTFFIILLCAIFCTPEAFAQKTVFGTKELPLEINILIDSLQNNHPENTEKMLPTIMSIDVYARSLTKEEVFLLGKIEVYKTLLKNYAAPIKQPIDGVSVEKIRSGINKSGNDPFIKWFLQALLKDSLDLIGNPLYKEFLLQKNANAKIEKIEYKKLEKKSELLQYWVSKISPNSEDFPENLKIDLIPKLMDVLKSIKNSFYLMAKESSFIPIASALKNESELKFFTVKDVTVAPKIKLKTQEQKSVEDILAPVINSSAQDLPAPSQENWLEDENAPLQMQNLPKPTNDAEWLQDF